jgi:hypothetical protein
MAVTTVFAGCSSTIPVSANRYPAVPVGSVQVLFQEPTRPYEVIALVGTEGNLTPFVADINGLRVAAAKVGADAVIVTEAKNQTFNSMRPSASGKAIRFRR